jgi:hypothetical protein
MFQVCCCCDCIGMCQRHGSALTNLYVLGDAAQSDFMNTDGTRKPRHNHTCTMKHFRVRHTSSETVKLGDDVCTDSMVLVARLAQHVSL